MKKKLITILLIISSNVMAHNSPASYNWNHFLEAGFDPFHDIQKVTLKSLYGTDQNKLQLFMNEAEIEEGRVESADMDIFFVHAIHQKWNLKGGTNYTYRPALHHFWMTGIGLEGELPYGIDTDARLYFHKGLKLDLQLEYELQIINKWFIETRVRSILATKTIEEDEIGSGLNRLAFAVAPFYQITPHVNLILELEHERNYGVLKRIQVQNGESTTENIFTFGFAIEI